MYDADFGVPRLMSWSDVLDLKQLIGTLNSNSVRYDGREWNPETLQLIGLRGSREEDEDRLLVKARVRCLEEGEVFDYHNRWQSFRLHASADWEPLAKAGFPGGE